MCLCRRSLPHPCYSLLDRCDRGLPYGQALYDHEDAVDLLIQPPENGLRDYPCIGPGWDNTPRLGGQGIILHGSRPTLFRRSVETALERVRDWDVEDRLIFVKSWNEWGEGNYLEPDARFGRGYLEALRDALAGY